VSARGAGEPGPVVSCRRCPEVRGPDGALTWVHERGPDGRSEWLCPACARAHVRHIEARLPDGWWV
jgi:hypothetical protein